MSDYAHTSDWTDADVEAFVALAARLEASPLDLAGCWMSESGLHTSAHNPNGGASGLFQVMPSTLHGLGYHDMRPFTGLPVQEQLHWAERYYTPHRGRLVSAGACYLATFLPALMAHATEPMFILCGRFGPHQEWYQANSGLDVNHDGWIRVQDLTDRIARVQKGSRWDEFASRVKACQQEADTEPEPFVISGETLPGDGDDGGAS